jgi:hypothetical protein
MNTLIRKLSEQALQLVADEHTEGDKSRLNTDSYHVKWLIQERFAELIIQECAELIDNKVTITAAQTYDEVFVARYDTKELCAKQIKEHFGIEE